jgi:hypothetical protein
MRRDAFDQLYRQLCKHIRDGYRVEDSIVRRIQDSFAASASIEANLPRHTKIDCIYQEAISLSIPGSRISRAEEYELSLCCSGYH